MRLIDPPLSPPSPPPPPTLKSGDGTQLRRPTAASLICAALGARLTRVSGAYGASQASPASQVTSLLPAKLPSRWLVSNFVPNFYQTHSNESLKLFFNLRQSQTDHQITSKQTTTKQTTLKSTSMIETNIV